MGNPDLITSVSINMELIMYGYVGFSIYQNGNDIEASWIAIADGGDVISNESKKLVGKHFRELVEKLISVKLPAHEDSEMSRSWSISFADKKNNQINGTESGFWDIEALNQIVDLIDCFTGDSDITEWLHNIIDA